jgi:tetratricopeptide (TPR) repeat protein
MTRLTARRIRKGMLVPLVVLALGAMLLSGSALLPAPALAAGGGGGGGDDPASDSLVGRSDAYKSGYKAIKAKDYKGGVEWMEKAIAKDPKDADALNWLGYSHRKLKEYPEALDAYKRALALDPDHRGAHEYLGEAYLEMNQLDDAKKELAILNKACWLPCEPYSELKEAVEDYEKAHK